MENNKVRQIFLDMDGVLADFESQIALMLGKKVWNDDAGHSVYDDHKRELTAKHMFRQMNPLPDAWMLTDWCLNSGIHTEILTAAGTVNREIVVRDKIEWIREHINPYWTIIPTFRGSQKAAFAHKKAGDSLMCCHLANINDGSDKTGKAAIMDKNAELLQNVLVLI